MGVRVKREVLNRVSCGVRFRPLVGSFKKGTNGAGRRSEYEEGGGERGGRFISPDGSSGKASDLREEGGADRSSRESELRRKT